MCYPCSEQDITCLSPEGYLLLAPHLRDKTIADGLIVFSDFSSVTNKCVTIGQESVVNILKSLVKNI